MPESRKLAILLKASKDIVQEKSLEKLLKKISDLSKEILEVDRCSLFLKDERKKVLWTVVAHGVDRIEVPWDKGIVGYVFQTGKPEIVLDPYKDKRFNKEVDKKTGYRTKNILAVPLFNKKGEVIGVFQAINKLKGIFTEEDLEILTLLGGYAAAAIENNLLYQQLEEAQKEIIKRLSFAAECKDKETKNHILRVGFFSKFIAKKLGFSEEDQEILFLTSQMHDIGKLGIPDSILLKPGRLTDEEFETMKKHTIIGYNLLKGSDNKLLKTAALIALEHHEKMDGSGYPYGKKGDEISIEARIVTVVDIFDALTSKRPYKDPWPIEKVIKVLKEDRDNGKLDPEVVNIVINNVDEFMKIKKELPDDEEITF